MASTAYRPPASVSSVGSSSEDSPLLLFRGQLTADEIKTAVDFLVEDVYGDGESLTDFTKKIFGSSSTKEEIQSRCNDEAGFREWMTFDYEDFNNTLKNGYAADVTIVNSTFVLNDNAKLINDSLSNEKAPVYNVQPYMVTPLSVAFEAGNIYVENSKIIANGNNELSARSGKVQFVGSVLDVADNAVLTFSSADEKLHLDGASTLELKGTMIGDVAADGATIDFQTSSARLNGTLSGSANVNFNADYALSDVTRGYGFSFRDIGIGDSKTLDIGATPLKADNITGGTISAILTDAAKTTPIITANAENVTIKLEMGTASTTKTTLYHITEGSGFKFGDYLTSRYAVSAKYFDPADASKIGALTNWDGGDLYILRLSAASMVKDMEVHPVIKDALKILDLNDKDLDKLTDKQQDALNKIDDLLTKFDGDTEKKYQVMREIAPDLSKFGILIDENHAKNVINVVSTRFNMPSAPRFAGYRRMYGRSGGDYEAGNGAVWAQGLYNHAEQRGTEGFSSDSAGFAAGMEAYLSDDFKVGLGYSYASTSIDADRSDVDVDTQTGFVYAQYQPKRFYTNFFAGFGRSSYNDTTKIAKLESEYQTNTISAQIAFGYAAPVLLSPEFAVRFINTHQKAYTDALGVELEDKNSSAATSVLGFKLSKRYRLKGKTPVLFMPELKAAATYDFVRTGSDRTAVLPNGTSYIVETDQDKRFGIEAGAGFSMNFGKSASLSLLYDGMFQGKLESHSVVMNAKINF